MVESIALGSFVSDTCEFTLLRKGAGGQGVQFFSPGFYVC